MELLRDIFPIRWFPHFRRGDWSEEEVIETRIIRAGSYDSNEIPDGVATFRDKMQGRNYRVKFEKGTIWLERG